MNFNEFLPSPILFYGQHHATFTLRTDDLKFIPNSTVSEWSSLADNIESERAILQGPQGAVTTTPDIVEYFRRKENAISLRFELTFLEDDPLVPILAIRAVPKLLEEMSDFNGNPDLATMHVAHIGLASVRAKGIVRTDGTNWALYPHVFTLAPIDMSKYLKIIQRQDKLDGFLCLCTRSKNHTFQSWSEAVKTRVTGNTKCFHSTVKNTKKSKKGSTTAPVIPARGIIRLSKYGASFDIRQYLGQIPPCLHDVVSLAYATSTWSSYRTGWKTYLDYLKRGGMHLQLPCPPDNILGFICYCYRTKNLMPNTVRHYLTALKAWQSLLNIPDTNFNTPYIRLILRGFGNLHRTKLKPPRMRSVVTWSVLKIFAKEIEELDIPALDKQVIWTCALLAFWGTTRMGELLEGKHGFDRIRALSWDRIIQEDAGHILVYLALPKTAKRKNGEIVDIFDFPQKGLCPINNLLRLAKMNKERRPFKLSNSVFALSTGKVLTMRRMNQILKNTLNKCFPVIGRFSCHSFRSGLPSIMGAFPQYFTEQMIREKGRWLSDSCRAYTKIHAIGYRDVHSKLVSILLAGQVNKFYLLNHLQGN
jgi:hypothetical protein